VGKRETILPAIRAAIRAAIIATVWPLSRAPQAVILAGASVGIPAKKTKIGQQL
jgi:hypothetical protein